MSKNDKPARLVSIDTCALGSVAGGKGLDVSDSWAFNTIATDSCVDKVLRAAANAGLAVAQGQTWDDAAWSAANDAANAVWNGPACSYYGWWW